MRPEKLVTMANGIAAFFAAAHHGARGGEGGGAAGVADHINKYWEPRMRDQLLAAVEEGRAPGLNALVVEALPLVRRPTKPLEERASKASDG